MTAPNLAPSLGELLTAHMGERKRKRLSLGLEAWARVQAAADEAGILVRMFGSMARGSAHERSDLDVLVISYAPYSRVQAMRLLERSAGSFPLDLVYAEDVPIDVQDTMLGVDVGCDHE
jgi:predicted nucleotidyltransferase